MKTDRAAQPSRMTASDRIRLAGNVKPRNVFPVTRALKWAALLVAVVVIASEAVKVMA